MSEYLSAARPGRPAAGTSGEMPLPSPDIFGRFRFSGDLNRAIFAQNHLYGIDCTISGAVDLLSEVAGALPLVHGTRTCGFQHRIFPLRISDPAYDLVCTEMGEQDIIYGGTDHLKRSIVETCRNRHPELIAVLASCISGLTGEDVSGIVEDLRDEVPCALVSVKTEGFRHRSNVARKDIGRYIKYLKDGVWVAEADGCGWDEATFALVDQLMEEQDIIEDTVVLECYSQYNYGYYIEFCEVKRILETMGLRLNTAFPHADVAHIKAAPSAEYIVTPLAYNCWPERMAKRFGTKCLKRTGYRSDFDAIGQFFLDVGRMTGREGEAEAAVKAGKAAAGAALAPYRRKFGGHSFALYSRSLVFQPRAAQFYVEELGIPLKYICIDTRHETSRSASPEQYRDQVNTSLDILRGLGLTAEILLDPDAATLRKVAGEVDYVLSDLQIRPGLPEGRDMTNAIDLAGMSMIHMRCSFTSAVAVAQQVYLGMEKTGVPVRAPLLYRLCHDPVYGQALDGPGCLASRKMWLDHGINSRV